MEEKLSNPSEISRPETFRNVYVGGFRDKNPNIRAAGILTYAPGENVKQSLRYVSNSAVALPSVDKFHHYASPDLGEIRIHYGRANDPKTYDTVTHGMRSGDKHFTTKDCINPEQLNKCESLKHEIAEMVYKTKKSAPLGKVPFLNLPNHIDPYKNTFGLQLKRDNNAKECINPDKDRPTVELETTDKHDQYIISHKDYEPGERKSRKFKEPFNDMNRFGKKTEALNDGTMVKRSMSWLPQTLLERRNQVESKLLYEFREKHSSQIGKVLDPNKDTRFLGTDHIFGLTNNTDQFGAADIVHSREGEKVLKGKERERAYIAALRSHLCGYNHTKFKTLVDAFKFYDKDKDGFVSKDELRFACAATNFPAGLDLVDSLLDESDLDKDGKLNFLEFSNFLCYKETMKLGIKIDTTKSMIASKINIAPFELAEQSESIYIKMFGLPGNPEDEDLKDDEGRFLLKKSDLMHKNNIAVNDLVPRTIVAQLDSKVGNWKTTYDIINDAPFKEEPQRKRVYGIPSIRNDLIPPNLKKIQDKSNYGNDGNVWSLVSPSLFAQHGVYERDFLRPRSKEEIKLIFKNIGNDIPQDLFDHIWDQAQSNNPYGEVSVEEFRSMLGRFNTKRLHSESKNEVLCS